MGSTYTKNGMRKHILDNNKNAMKQISNMSNIISNMGTLMESLDKYDGLLTKDNLDEVAMLINREKRLQLLEDQVKIVTKRYGQD